MSSNNAERIQRLERRLSGLNRSFNQLREENRELREEIATLKEFENRAGDQLIDLHERLEDHRDRFRQIKVNEHRINDIYLRLQGKVGISAFEILEERIKQVRTQIDFLGDAVEDLLPWSERETVRLAEQES